MNNNHEYVVKLIEKIIYYELGNKAIAFETICKDQKEVSNLILNLDSKYMILEISLRFKKTIHDFRDFLEKTENLETGGK